jgi:DNA-binding transcriptional LysR family regulator
MRSSRSSTRASHDLLPVAFKQLDRSLNVKYEVDAIAVIMQCVKAGLGVSLLPGGCIHMETDQRE